MLTYKRTLVKDFQRDTMRLAQTKAAFLRAKKEFDKITATFKKIEAQYASAKEGVENAEVAFDETIRLLVHENIDLDICARSPGELPVAAVHHIPSTHKI
ncbi:MAG: hypothetical protein OXR66_05985 [Candidatus Woesearchaeota archaeon]|nr:hypothetical protein [Candidatus Woesearchaeota archaeon]